MTRDKQKDARDRALSRLEGRPKALRRELSDLEGELEKARRRRDRAQARVEALEAIAEQLGVALQAAEAARDRRATPPDEQALDQPAAAVADDDVATGDDVVAGDGSVATANKPKARPKGARKARTAS